MLPALETIAVETQPKADVIAEAKTLTIQPEEETRLTAEIDSLWLAHNEANALRRHTAAELRAIKLKLGERLSAVKRLLSRPGRGGKYHAWLRERHIPRSSSDRLIERYLETVGDRVNAHDGAIPVEDAIEKLLTAFVQKTKQLLPDGHDQYHFGYRFMEKLGLQVEEEDESFIVVEPEIESGEPLDDASGNDLFTPSGHNSDEAPAGYGEANPSVDDADDQPPIIS